jgi:hypothetical protein
MKHSLYIAGSCLLALVLLFMTVDPDHVPSFMLVLPFVLLSILLISVVSFFLQRQGVGSKKGIKIAVLCSSLPMLLLVLQSIGQLTVRDVLVVLLLFGLSFFYISRTSIA